MTKKPATTLLDDCRYRVASRGLHPLATKEAKELNKYIRLTATGLKRYIDATPDGQWVEVKTY